MSCDLIQGLNVFNLKRFNTTLNALWSTLVQKCNHDAHWWIKEANIQISNKVVLLRKVKKKNGDDLKPQKRILNVEMKIRENLLTKKINGSCFSKIDRI